MGKSLITGIFIPVKLVSNPLASCPLRNFDFLLLHTILLFLQLLDFYFLYFLYTSNNKITLF